MANYRLAEDFSATQIEAIESGANPSQFGPRPGTQGAWVKLTRGNDEGKLAFHYLPIPHGGEVEEVSPSEALREIQGLGVAQAQGSLPGPEQVQRNSAQVGNPYDVLAEMQATQRLSQNSANEWMGMLQQAGVSPGQSGLTEVPLVTNAVPDVWGIFEPFGITPTFIGDQDDEFESFHLGDPTGAATTVGASGIGFGNVQKLLAEVREKVLTKNFEKLEDDGKLIFRFIDQSGQEMVALHPKAITTMVHALLQIESTMPVKPSPALTKISNSGTPSELLGARVSGRIENTQGIARATAISEFLNEESDVMSEHESPEDNSALEGDIRYSQRYPSRTTHITANAHYGTDKNIVNRLHKALGTVTGTLNWEVLTKQRPFTAEDILQAFPRMPGLLEDTKDVTSVVYALLWLQKNLPQEYASVSLFEAQPAVIDPIMEDSSRVPEILRPYFLHARAILRAPDARKWQGITKSQEFKDTFPNMEVALSLDLSERIKSAKMAIDFNDVSGISESDGSRSSPLIFAGKVLSRNYLGTPTQTRLSDGRILSEFVRGHWAIDDNDTLWAFEHADGSRNLQTGEVADKWRKIGGTSSDFVSALLSTMNIEEMDDGSSYIVPITKDTLQKQGEIAAANFSLDKFLYLNISPEIPNGSPAPYIEKIKSLLGKNPFSYFHARLFADPNVSAAVSSDLYGRYGPPQAVADISNEEFEHPDILMDFIRHRTSEASIGEAASILRETKRLGEIVSENQLAKNYIQDRAPQMLESIFQQMSISQTGQNNLLAVGGGAFGSTDVFIRAIVYSYLMQNAVFSRRNLPALTPQHVSDIAELAQALHANPQNLTDSQKQKFLDVMRSVKSTISVAEGLDQEDLKNPVTYNGGSDVRLSFAQRFDELVESCVAQNFSENSLFCLANLINDKKYTGSVDRTRVEYGNYQFSDVALSVLEKLVRELSLNSNFIPGLSLSSAAKSRIGLVRDMEGVKELFGGPRGQNNPGYFLSDTQKTQIINSGYFRNAVLKIIFSEEIDNTCAASGESAENVKRAVRLNEPQSIADLHIRELFFPSADTLRRARSGDTQAGAAVGNAQNLRAFVAAIGGLQPDAVSGAFDGLPFHEKARIESLFKQKVGSFSERPITTRESYVHEFNAGKTAEDISRALSSELLGTLGIDERVLPSTDNDALEHIVTTANTLFSESAPVTNKLALDLMVAYEAAHKFFALTELKKKLDGRLPQTDGFDIPRTFFERTGNRATGHYQEYKEFYDLLLKSAENKLGIAKTKNIRIIRGNDAAFPASLQISHPSSSRANPMGLTDSLSILGNSNLLQSGRTAAFHGGVNGIGLDVPSVESGDTNQLHFWADTLSGATEQTPDWQINNAQAKMRTLSREIREVAAHYLIETDNLKFRTPDGEFKSVDKLIGFFDTISNKTKTDIISQDSKTQIALASAAMSAVLTLITAAKEKYINEEIRPFVQKMIEAGHHIVVTHGYDRTGGLTIRKTPVFSSVAQVPFSKTPWQRSDDIIHNIFWSTRLMEEPSAAEKSRPDMFDSLAGSGLNFAAQNSAFNLSQRSAQTFSYLGTTFDNISDAFATAILVHPANNFAIPDVQKFIGYLQDKNIRLSELIGLNGDINQDLLRHSWLFPSGNGSPSWYNYTELVGPGKTEDEYFKYQLASALSGAYHQLGGPVLKDEIHKRLGGILRGIFAAKILQNESLKNALLATGNVKLSGANANIFMSIRQQLQSGVTPVDSRLIIIPRSSTFSASEIKHETKRSFDVAWQDAYHLASVYDNAVISPTLPVSPTFVPSESEAVDSQLPIWSSGDFVVGPNGIIALPRDNGLKLVQKKINSAEVIAVQGSADSGSTYSQSTSINEGHNQEEAHAIKLALSRNIFLGNLPSLQPNFEYRSSQDQRSPLDVITDRLRSSYGQNRAVTVLQSVLASFKSKGLLGYKGFAPAIFTIKLSSGSSIDLSSGQIRQNSNFSREGILQESSRVYSLGNGAAQTKYQELLSLVNTNPHYQIINGLITQLAQLIETSESLDPQEFATSGLQWLMRQTSSQHKAMWYVISQKIQQIMQSQINFAKISGSMIPFDTVLDSARVEENVLGQAAGSPSPSRHIIHNDLFCGRMNPFDVNDTSAIYFAPMGAQNDFLNVWGNGRTTSSGKNVLDLLRLAGLEQVAVPLLAANISGATLEGIQNKSVEFSDPKFSSIPKFLREWGTTNFFEKTRDLSFPQLDVWKTLVVRSATQPPAPIIDNPILRLAAEKPYATIVPSSTTSFAAIVDPTLKSSDPDIVRKITQYISAASPGSAIRFMTPADDISALLSQMENVIYFNSSFAPSDSGINAGALPPEELQLLIGMSATSGKGVFVKNVQPLGEISGPIAVFNYGTDESRNARQKEYQEILRSGANLIVSKLRIATDYDRNNELPQGDLGGVLNSGSARTSSRVDGIVVGAINFGISYGALWNVAREISPESYGSYSLGPVQNIVSFSSLSMQRAMVDKEYQEALRLRQIPYGRGLFIQTVSPFNSSEQNLGTLHFVPQLNAKLNPNTVLASLFNNATGRRTGQLDTIVPGSSALGAEIPVLHAYKLTFGNNDQFVAEVRVGNFKRRTRIGSSDQFGLQIDTVYSVEIYAKQKNGSFVKVSENTYAQPYRVAEESEQETTDGSGRAILAGKRVGGPDRSKTYFDYEHHARQMVHALAKTDVANYVTAAIHQLIDAAGRDPVAQMMPAYGPQVNPLFPTRPIQSSGGGIVSSAQVNQGASHAPTSPVKLLSPNQKNGEFLYGQNAVRARDDLSVFNGSYIDTFAALRNGAGILLPETITSLINFGKSSIELSAPTESYWLRLPAPYRVTRENFGLNSQESIERILSPFDIPNKITEHVDANGSPMTVSDLVEDLIQMAITGTFTPGCGEKMRTVMMAISPKIDGSPWWVVPTGGESFFDEQHFVQNFGGTAEQNWKKTLDFWTTVFAPSWNRINELHEVQKYLTGQAQSMSVSEEVDPHVAFSRHFNVPVDIVRQMTQSDFADYYNGMKLFTRNAVQTSGAISTSISSAINSAIQNIHAAGALGGGVVPSFAKISDAKTNEILKYIANSGGDFSQIGTAVGDCPVQNTNFVIPAANVERIADEILASVGYDRIFGFGEKIRDFAKLTGRFIESGDGWLGRLTERSGTGTTLSEDANSPVIATIFSGSAFDTGGGIKTPSHSEQITQFHQDLWAETFLTNMARQRAQVISTFMPILTYSGINKDVQGAQIRVSADMPAIITTRNGSVNKTVMEVLSALYVPEGTGVDFSSVVANITNSMTAAEKDHTTGLYADQKHALIINPLLMGNSNPENGPVDLRTHFLSSLFANLAFVSQSDTSFAPNEMLSDRDTFKKLLGELEVDPETGEGMFVDHLLEQFFTKNQISGMDGRARRAFIYAVFHAMSRHLRPDFDQVNISNAGLELRDKYLAIKSLHGIDVPELINADADGSKSIGHAIPSAPIGTNESAETRRQEIATAPFIRQIILALYRTGQTVERFIPNINDAHSAVQQGYLDILSNNLSGNRFDHVPLTENETEAAIWLLNPFSISGVFRPEIVPINVGGANPHSISYERYVPDSANPGSLFVNQGATNGRGSRVIQLVRHFVSEITDQSRFHTFVVNSDSAAIRRSLERRLSAPPPAGSVAIMLSDTEKTAIVSEAIQRAMLGQVGHNFNGRSEERLRQHIGENIGRDFTTLASLAALLSGEIRGTKRKTIGQFHEEQRSKVARARGYFAAKIEEASEKIAELRAQPQNSITRRELRELRGIRDAHQLRLDVQKIDEHLQELWGQLIATRATGWQQYEPSRLGNNSFAENFLGPFLSSDDHEMVFPNHDAHVAKLGEDVIAITPANVILSQSGIDSKLSDLVGMAVSGSPLLRPPATYQHTPNTNAVIFSMENSRSRFSPYSMAAPITFTVAGPNNVPYTLEAKTLAQFVFAMDYDAQTSDGLEAMRTILDIDLSRGRGSIKNKIERIAARTHAQYDQARLNTTQTPEEQEMAKLILGLRLQASQNPQRKDDLLQLYDQSQNSSIPVIAVSAEPVGWAMMNNGLTYEGYNILGQAIQNVSRSLALAETIPAGEKLSTRLHEPLSQIISNKLNFAATQRRLPAQTTLSTAQLSVPFLGPGYTAIYDDAVPVESGRRIGRGNRIVGPGVRLQHSRFFEYFNLLTDLGDASRSRAVIPGAAREESVRLLCLGPDGAITAIAGRSPNDDPNSLPIKNILHYLILSKFTSAPIDTKRALCGLMTRGSTNNGLSQADLIDVLLGNKTFFELPNRNIFLGIGLVPETLDSYVHTRWEETQDLYLAYAMARVALDKGLMETFASSYFDNIHQGLTNLAYWAPSTARSNWTEEANAHYGVTFAGPRVGAAAANEAPTTYRGHNAIGKILTWLIKKSKEMQEASNLAEEQDVDSHEIEVFMDGIEREIYDVSAQSTGYPNYALSQILELESDPEFALDSSAAQRARDGAQERLRQERARQAGMPLREPPLPENLDRDPDADTQIVDDPFLFQSSLANKFVLNILKKSVSVKKRPNITFKISATRKCQ